MNERGGAASRPALQHRSVWFALGVLLVAGTLAYSRTFDVPWYLDDVSQIVENDAIRDLSAALANLLAPRGIGFATFALNFHFSGLSLAAFHATNLAIHLAAGVVVFLVLLRLFRKNVPAALAGALVFALHPLQSQAVTYVVQRFSSFAALLCLLALLLYLVARDRYVERRRWQDLWVVLPGALALLAGGAACFVKQNAVVLPGLLALVEWLLPAAGEERTAVSRRLLRLLPFAVIPARVVLAEAGLGTGSRPLDLSGGSAFETDVVGEGVSALAYFATELEVIWRYVARVILPIRQVFDYGLGVASSPWRLTSILAGAGLMTLVVVVLRRGRAAPWLPAGVCWFFLALAVESSFLPLDPYFEHRLYLPMFGVALVVSGFLSGIRPGGERLWFLIAAGVLLTLATLTLLRNEHWREPFRLWSADLEHGSQSYRSALGLADALYRNGEEDEALEVYRVFLGRADERCRKVNCGSRYLLNMGVATERLGELEQAELLYRRAIHRDSANAVAYFNLGVVEYGSGRLELARESFRRAAVLSPGDADAVFNHSWVALDLGDPLPAREALQWLERANLAYAERLRARLDAQAAK